MRKGDLSKYKYFINKLGDKYLKENYEEEEYQDGGSTEDLYPEILDLVNSGSYKEAAQELQNIKMDSKDAYKNITNELIADYQSGKDAEDIRNFFSYYFTEVDTRVINKLSKNYPDLTSSYPDFFKRTAQEILSGQQIGDMEQRRSMGLDHISNFDLLKGYSNKGYMFDTFLSTTLGHLGSERRKKDKGGIQTVSLDKPMGTDSDAGTIGDKIASPDDDSKGYIYDNISFDGKEVFFWDNPIGIIKTSKGKSAFIVNKNLPKEQSDIFQSNEFISNVVEKYILEEKDLGDVHMWVDTGSASASGGDFVPSLNPLFTTPEEQLKFYNTFKDLQKKALAYTKSLPGKKRAGFSNWIKDTMVENEDYQDLINLVDNWARYSAADNAIFDRFLYSILGEYSKNALGYQIPGTVENPKTKADFDTNRKAVYKFLSSTKTQETAEEQQIHNKLVQILRSYTKGKSSKFNDEVSKYVSDDNKALLGLIKDSLEGNPGKQKLSTSIKDPQYLQFLLTNAVDAIKGSTYNDLGISNFGKTSGNYQRGWIESNMDLINDSVSEAMILQMMATDDRAQFGKLNPSSPADRENPARAYDYNKAKYIMNYKPATAGTGGGGDMTIDDQKEFDQFEENIKSMYPNLDGADKRKAEQMYDKVKADFHKSISDLQAGPKGVKAKDKYNKAIDKHGDTLQQRKGEAGIGSIQEMKKCISVNKNLLNNGLSF